METTQTKHILLIDASAVAHQIWHTIEPTTPALELKIFREQYFRAFYQATLEVHPDITVLACDSDDGRYWRHDEYFKRYRDITEFAIDETGMLWVRHDLNVYSMVQTEASTWLKIRAKNKDEKAKAPREFVQGLQNFVEGLQADNNPMLEHYKQLASRNVPRYKGKRGESRWDNKTTKTEWHEFKNKLNDDLCEAMGMWKICVKGAEADDIAAFAATNKPDAFHLTFISVDGDWDQLQAFENVTRLDPVKNEFIKVDDPLYALKVKVITGDAGDNIPSIKVPKEGKGGLRYTGVGPKPAMAMIEEGGITKRARMEGWDDQLEFNTKMISLAEVPEEIENAIAEQFEVKPKQATGNLERFGLPAEEIYKMRAMATVKHVKFSGMPTADGDEEV